MQKEKGLEPVMFGSKRYRPSANALIDLAMDDLNLHKKRSQNSRTELQFAIAPQQVMRENLVIGVKNSTVLQRFLILKPLAQQLKNNTWK